MNDADKPGPDAGETGDHIAGAGKAEGKGPMWLPPEQREAIASTLGGDLDGVMDAAAADVADAAAPPADDAMAADADIDEEAAGPVIVSEGTSRIDDGTVRGDDPLRDMLLQLGFLSDEQVQRVEAHAEKRSLDFDQAALELGFITPDDLDRAREQLIGSFARPVVRRRPLSDELVVLSDPRGVRAESIRLLRTQIIAQHIKSGRRGLAMVSPAPGSGCSILVANLAVSLAQVGIKTLLVDADLRAPRQHEIFGLDADGMGLSSYLSMQVNRPERVVQANVVPSLSLITAGPSAPRPQELLSSRRFRDGVNTLLREYDIVLFDTSPANGSADALTVGAAAGYVMLAARRDKAFFKDITTLVDQLQAARCPVIGSVLNEF